MVSIFFKLVIQIGILAVFAFFLPWIFWPVFIIFTLYVFVKWLFR